MTRDTFGATAETNLTGLESTVFQLLRWDGDSVLFNDISDQSTADVKRIAETDGVFDDPVIRQTRTDRPDTFGTNPGKALLSERIISLTGYVSAGNFPMMRKLQRDIKQNLAFKTVNSTDREFWKFRIWTRGPQTIDLANPNFETNALGWVYDTNDTAATTFARLVNGSLGGSAVLQMKKTSLGANKYAAATFDNSVQARIPVFPTTHCVASCRGNIISLAAGASSYIALLWYDSNGTYLGSTDGAHSTSTGVQPYTVAGDAPANAASVSIKAHIYNAGTSGTAEAYWDQFSFLGPSMFEAIRCQPAGCQMPEKQDSGSFKRPFLITLKASDPRIYLPEKATTALVGATQNRVADENVYPYSPPSISITGRVVNASSPFVDSGLGTAKYVLGHIPPYINWPTYETDSRGGVMLQSLNAGLDGDFLGLVLTGANEIKLVTYDGNIIASTLHTFTLPFEARNKHVYLRAYMSSASVVACQAYTSRPFTIANKASEPNILLDSSYTLTGADLTKFGGTVTNVVRGYILDNYRPTADPTFAWFSWIDVEVDDITESPLSQAFTVSGDLPTPVKVRIDGPIVNPTVRITQTSGSTIDGYEEDIAFLLYTTLTSGQYVEWDPWTGTWTHSAGGSVLTAPGNKYNDLAPGGYTAVMRGSGTDTTHSALTITTREAIS